MLVDVHACSSALSLPAAGWHGLDWTESYRHAWRTDYVAFDLMWAATDESP